MKREFLQNIKVSDQPLPKEVIDSILNEHSRSIGTLKAEKENLETQLQTTNLGFNIPEVKPPQIPMLAKGAVLPANKPFLAMVGDQKHGTNVEALWKPSRRLWLSSWKTWPPAILPVLRRL